jgi:hypothetical protein
MQVVYVDEYQPSSASLTLQDPIYKVSQDNERIRIGKAGLPSYAIILLPLIVIGGIGLIYLATRKS